jgi:uncharacterized SAM-binding protein YcdF (DUF218 family)
MDSELTGTALPGTELTGAELPDTALPGTALPGTAPTGTALPGTAPPPDSHRPKLVTSLQSLSQRLAKLCLSIARQLAWISLSLTRGLAFFLGTYAALSLLASIFQQSYNPNTWWIDLSWLPGIISYALQAALVAVLFVHCFKVFKQPFWRTIAALVCLCFGAIALRDALRVLAVANAGYVRLGFPVPFSTFIMAAFLVLAVAVFFGNRAQFDAPGKLRRWATATLSVLMLMLCGIAFPIGQLYCFGLTDYRAEVDAVVIFGAQVHPSGVLSGTLASRVDKGIELYEQGYTPLLIMSGGTGIEGVNEAEAMRRYAIERGVPAEAILLDREGNNSELTVLHTIALAEAYNLNRIVAVSSSYHLPRIKMLFLSHGFDVLTVPTDGIKEAGSLYTAGIREIPGWWFYWFKFVFALG